MVSLTSSMAAARVQEETGAGVGTGNQGPRLLNLAGGYVPFLSRVEAEGQEGDAAAAAGTAQQRAGDAAAAAGTAQQQVAGRPRADVHHARAAHACQDMEWVVACLAEEEVTLSYREGQQLAMAITLVAAMCR